MQQGRTRRGVVIAIALTVIASACGGGGDESADVAATADSTADDVETTAAEPSVTTSPSDGTAEPVGAGVGQTAACDRVTPAELSAAFGVTFEDGTEITDGQCLFDSDGSPQFLLAIYTGSPTACEVLGADLETIEIAERPGWWDQAGAQARVCFPDGSIAVILSGGGGDNSIHRDALLTLLTTSTTR